MKYQCPTCHAEVRIHRTGSTLTIDEHRVPDPIKTWIHPIGRDGKPEESVMIDIWKRCYLSGARVELP